MRRLLTPIFFLVALVVTQGCASAQANLRPELEKTFEAYKSALATKDAEKLKRSLASFRYVRMRNQAVSRRETFPDSLFAEIERHGGFPIDLKGLTYIRTVEKGDAAYMIYVGKESPDKDRPVVPTITNVLFVREAGQWKFAEAERSYLGEEDLKTPPAELAKDVVPTFHESAAVLDGKIPPVPPEYPVPDYIGSILIEAENCKVTVKFNAESDSLEQEQAAWPILGGLKRGKNPINIIVAAPSRNTTIIDGPVHARVDVWVYLDKDMPRAKTFPNDRVKVFSFETGSLGEVKKEFEVSDEILKKGEPVESPRRTPEGG